MRESHRGDWRQIAHMAAVSSFKPLHPGRYSIGTSSAARKGTVPKTGEAFMGLKMSGPALHKTENQKVIPPSWVNALPKTSARSEIETRPIQDWSKHTKAVDVKKRKMRFHPASKIHRHRPGDSEARYREVEDRRPQSSCENSKNDCRDCRVRFTTKE